MGDCHPVLGEGACLVGADAGGGAEGLHGLQVLHQAVLGGHPLGGEGQADGYSGEQSLRYVGNNDSDEEDDGIQPVVTKDEGNDEEADTKEDCDPSDDMDEMSDLLCNGGVSSVEA